MCWRPSRMRNALRTPGRLVLCSRSCANLGTAMERLPIDFKLWALVSGLLFVSLVCVDVFDSIGGGATSLGVNVRLWQTGAQTIWQLLDETKYRLIIFAG